MREEPTVDPQLVDSETLPDPVQPVPAATADESAVPDDAWKRFHKATPWLSVWQVWAAILAFIVTGAFNALDSGEDLSSLYAALVEALREFLLWVLLAIIVVTALGLLWASLSWRKKEYAFVPSGIHVRQGIFTKQHRHVRWDRIQSVQIRQGLIPRILGLGSLDIDSASGGSGMLSLGLLKTAELSSLRSHILATAAAARSGSDLPGQGQEEPVFDVDDVYEGQAHFYKLGTKRLVMTTLCSADFVGTVLAVLGIIGLALGTGESFSLILLLAIFGQLTSLWGKFNGAYGHTMFLTKDGIRIRRGLTKTVTQTVLPGKIHAVELKQPFLWRPFGLWRVSVTIAGGFDTADGDGISEMLTRQVLIPAGSKDEALTFLWTIVPNIGVEDVDGFFADALEGRGESAHFVTAPAGAKLLDPFAHKRNGYCVTDTVAVVRGGYFAPILNIALHGHWQGLAAKQGPLQRRNDLATGTIALIPGLVTWTAKNLAREDIIALTESELAAGKKAMAVSADETVSDWARRVGVA